LRLTPEAQISNIWRSVAANVYLYRNVFYGMVFSLRLQLHLDMLLLWTFSSFIHIYSNALVMLLHHWLLHSIAFIPGEGFH
jgi:hypothetical protein